MDRARLSKHLPPSLRCKRPPVWRAVNGPGKKMGRPKGSVTIDAVEYEALLNGWSRDSCRWSRRWNRPMRILNASLSTIHREDVRINSLVSYRTFVRQAGNGRCGFSKPRRDTDKCDICQMWDKHACSSVTALWTRWRNELRAEAAANMYNPKKGRKSRAKQ